MSPLVRWCRFNLVGVMGAVVQLISLALFNRCFAGHYLYASAAALEVTLLHNFLWHLRYTWKDRSGTWKDRSGTWNDRSGNGRLIAQLARFHLSNGFVSMLGNLVLMRVLVDEAHLPLLVSNGIAILCCSAINFGLSDYWAFAPQA